MKLSYAQYMRSKKGTGLGSWVLLHGPEQHLKREVLARLREQARGAGGEEATWEVLAGPETTARELVSRCHTGALFGETRVIVVQEAERIDAREQQALAKAVGPLREGVALILVTGEATERRRAAAVGKALRDAIEERGVVIECSALKVAEAAAWAVARAKARGKRLEQAVARKLVEQKIGTRLGDLEAEIEKLISFVGDRPAISTADVDEVTPRMVEEDVFRMLDAVAGRQPARAVAILRGLLRERRERPERILGRLGQGVREVWQVKALTERGWRPGMEPDEEAAALLPEDPRKNALAQLRGRREFLLDRAVARADQLTWAQLTKAMRALKGCDLALKGIRGRVGDEALALELLVIQLCTDVEMPDSGGPARLT